jgi:hypothetical protein
MASSAIGYLDAGLPKIAAIAWYRLPFETVAVASIDGEFLSMHSSDARKRQNLPPAQSEGTSSKHRKSRCGRFLL